MITLWPQIISSKSYKCVGKYCSYFFSIIFVLYRFMVQLRNIFMGYISDIKNQMMLFGLWNSIKENSAKKDHLVLCLKVCLQSLYFENVVSPLSLISYSNVKQSLMEIQFFINHPFWVQGANKYRLILLDTKEKNYDYFYFVCVCGGGEAVLSWCTFQI